MKGGTATTAKFSPSYENSDDIAQSCNAVDGEIKELGLVQQCDQLTDAVDK